ncbi:MAG TPA: cytochrome c biogenesis protein CcdA [Kiritimatiellia bacterium]|nr:cytochrome c biogenesis protein CcdA [Kiritimatiellia bacterium]HRR33803.1 cytochrome c biogenesis protein CcdA [Kiritimatiellia bacterium]
MEWFRSLLTSATAAFDQAGVGFMAIPLALALGLLSAVVSTCCTLPVLGIIVGYAGARKDNSLRSRLMSAGSFFLGAVLSLVILGAVAAMVGQVAQGTLGRYWKVFAGFAAIVLGLGSLNLLPFTLPQGKARFGVRGRSGGILGALLFGIVGGGAVSVSSLACNPGIFIIIGAAVLQGVTLWMTAVLIAYAVGFALPLGALMLGVSLGAAAVRFKGLETAVRGLAGVLLVAAGFYFLWSF